MKKLVAVMCMDNWEPEITSRTFPLLRHYAKKIGADFWLIDERKYPDCPIGYERFQIYDVADQYDWVLQIDADLVMHPDMPDVTSFVNKDTILISRPDHAAKRFQGDPLFWRDGRYISVPGFFTVTSDWCRDFWRLPDDLTPQEAIARVTPLEHEWDRWEKTVVDGSHLVVDYIWSRNVARYGLKYKTFQECFVPPLLNPIHDYVMHNAILPIHHKRQHIKNVVEKYWKLKLDEPPFVAEERMNKSQEYFERNGYVVLHGALNHNRCAELVEHMFGLAKQGETTKDSQCPLSDGVYGDPVLDDLLQKFAKPIGDAVGRRLLPTYSYARIYRPGEVLKRHKDRPACEISATLTLGYDAKPVWPIFFDEDKEIGVSLDVGELAVYKGCEIVHWRTAFKGQWHVQVFLHYVDENGPYKDHYRDGRPAFGVQKNQNVAAQAISAPQQQQKPQSAEAPPINSLQSLPRTTFSRPVFNTVTIPGNDRTFPGYFPIDEINLPELRFTREECEAIIAFSQKAYASNASVGGSADNSRISKEIRSANIYVLENDSEHKWIYEKVANIVAIVNGVHFDYDLSGITHGLQLIEYRADDPVQGHYEWHVDAGPGEPAYRKISFTAQLSDPRSYQGCELLVNNHAAQVTATKEQGSVHLFPSYMPHQVTPITQGVRYALVIWIHGPRRFR